jgi:hypothetical protein
MLRATAPASTNANLQISQCAFFGGYQQIVITNIVGVNDSSEVKTTLLVGPTSNAFGIIGKVNVTNCTIAFTGTGASGLFYNTGSATFPSVVKNNIFAHNDNGIYVTTSNSAIESNNRFVGVITARTNISAGTGSTTIGNFGFDLFESLLYGLLNVQPFGSTANSVNTGFGNATGAPASDLFGINWTGVSPDAGSITYRTVGGISPYFPTERNASTITIAPGSTSQSIELYLGVTGLTASTSGLTARYNRTRTASVSIPLVARTIAQAWISGGFAEVDATNMPGVYRLDLPDAALAAGADDVTIVVRGASGTNGAVMTVKLSSGGLTSAQTASAVWGADPSSYITATEFGGVLNETRSLVGSTEVLVQALPQAVWDEPKVSHATAGTFGDYLDAKVSTVADTARIQLRQGPFLIKQNATEGLITEVNQFLSTVPNMEMVLIDSSGGAVSVNGSTLVLRVRNQAGTAVVNNVTPTVAYADGGVIRWTPNQSWTALGVTTAGTYRIIVERTMGTTTTTFGPFLVQLSSG